MTTGISANRGVPLSRRNSFHAVHCGHVDVEQDQPRHRCLDHGHCGMGIQQHRLPAIPRRSVPTPSRQAGRRGLPPPAPAGSGGGIAVSAAAGGASVVAAGPCHCRGKPLEGIAGAVHGLRQALRIVRHRPEQDVVGKAVAAAQFIGRTDVFAAAQHDRLRGIAPQGLPRQYVALMEAVGGSQVVECECQSRHVIALHECQPVLLGGDGPGSR